MAFLVLQRPRPKAAFFSRLAQNATKAYTPGNRRFSRIATENPTQEVPIQIREVCRILTIPRYLKTKPSIQYSSATSATTCTNLNGLLKFKAKELTIFSNGN
jgi:hypothetical protein